MKKLLLTGVACISLTSCAVGPDFLRPGAPDVKRYTDTDMPAKTAASDNKSGAAQVFAQNKPLQADWWKEFGSPELNTLVEQALAANPDLQAAKASLKQAQENMRSTIGELYPQVDAKFAPSRNRVTPSSFGQSGPSSLYNLYNASIDVSYAIDLFGATQREVEALQAAVDYQRYELEAAYLTLTANVVNAAIAEASFREQIEETKDIIAIQREQADLLQKQFDLGAIPKTNLLEQQALVAQTETTLPPLEKQLAQQRNLLAILAGRMPADGIGQTFDLVSLHLPQELPLTLPSSLVEQRPDIRASEAQLHAANAQVGVSTAAMLPQISLSGGYGVTSTGIHSLFTPDSLVWNLGGNLLQPLFHGGELLHAKRASVAAWEKSQAQYKSVVLQAFQNVADTLRALQYDADALAARVKAEHTASESFKLSREQYEAGAIPYTQMLDTQRTWQETRIGLVQAEAARLSDTVALYQSLGGGWWNREAKNTSVLPAVAVTPVAVAPIVAAPADTLKLTAPAASEPVAAPPFILLPPANPSHALPTPITEEKKP